MKMDAVERPPIDRLVEVLEGAARVAGGGPQHAAELEQPRLVELDGESALDVVPGSASIADEGADPRSNQVCAGRIG